MEKLKRPVVNEKKNESNGNESDSYGNSGIVVGWGAIEKYGDNGASRGFLKELNKKKFSVVRNERNLTQVLKVADMDDVLRLRKVELPFIDRPTCERWYASRGRPIRLIDAQFCAGLYEGGKDACRVGNCSNNCSIFLYYNSFVYYHYRVILVDQFWNGLSIMIVKVKLSNLNIKLLALLVLELVIELIDWIESIFF